MRRMHGDGLDGVREEAGSIERRPGKEKGSSN